MKKNFLRLAYMLLGMMAVACSGSSDLPEPDPVPTDPVERKGVFILNEGNWNAGNSSLSFYNPQTGQVSNGLFASINSRKLGDVAQSLTLEGNKLWIPVENSGIVWAVNANTLKVEGQVEAKGEGNQMVNPRYIHFVNSTKAYITDLYAPIITVINPQTYQKIKYIDTKQEKVDGYASTEQMVQSGNYVFVTCWSYNNKVLVIDIRKDEVVKEIEMPSKQPKSIALDAEGTVWVVTDGGNEVAPGSKNNHPYLVKINATTLEITGKMMLDMDYANVQVAMNGKGNTLYILNNHVYKMNIHDANVPVKPFVEAPADHKFYSIGIDPETEELYVGDAIDYRQTGMVFRYDTSGKLMDSFRVGITPNSFCFKK